MKNRLLLIILLVSLWSCTSTNDQASEAKIVTIKVPNEVKSEIDFEDLIDSCEFIPISNTPVIGAVDNFIAVNDSLYFLADSRESKQLLIVDKKGNIKNSYKYFGKGPNEGLALGNIQYDNDNHLLLALLETPNKILAFDRDLNFIKTKSFSTNNYRRLFVDSIYYLYDHEHSKYYSFYNWEGKEIEFKNTNSPYHIFYPTQVFYKTTFNTYINSPRESMIYNLKKGVFHDAIIFEADTIRQPVEMLGNKMEFYPPTITNIIETGSHLILFYSFNFQMQCMVYSKLDGKVVLQGYVMDLVGYYAHIFDGNDKMIYGVMPALNFNQFIKKMATVKDSKVKVILPKNYSTVQDTDNPLIVHYYLKSNFKQ